MVKKKVEQTKPKKCFKVMYRVKKEKQWRDFDTQEEARRHLIECLEKGAITFCSIIKKKVEGC